MQMLLSGFLLGFTISFLLFDDLAERKLRKYIEEEKRIKNEFKIKSVVTKSQNDGKEY